MGDRPQEAEPKPATRAEERPSTLEPLPSQTQSQTQSWATEKSEKTQEREEKFDYNAELRGSDIYQSGNEPERPRDQSSQPKDAEAPNPRDRDYRPEDGAQPRDVAEKTKEGAALKKADKNFPSIDAAMKERGAAKDETILPEKLPEPLPPKLEGLPGATKEGLEKIRDEIRTNNLDPEKVLPSLMKDVRVLGLGETHDWDNPQRQFGTKMMPELAKNGATHLAIEVDSDKQPIFDEFMKTGKLDMKDLPALLQDEEFVKMLNAARENGMKIVAVDDHSHRHRDQAMAANIGKVLDQNPENKVVFWVGSAHLERLTDPDVNQEVKTASQILEQKYKTATVVPNIPERDGSTLPHATPDLARPTLLPISRMPATSEFRSSRLDIPKSWYHNADFVIMYPNSKKN